MKSCFGLLLIFFGQVISVPFENGKRTEQQTTETKRELTRLVKRGIIDSLWQWMYPPPPPPFFAGDKRPKGLPGISNGTEIKQNLPTDAPDTPPYFVTLFDATRNIPFYSAYKVTPAQAPYIGSHGRQEANWREPPGAHGVDNAYKEAITKDKQKLSRGHMDPSGINSFNETFMKATFTLSNAAPQFQTSNDGPWSTFEDKIRNYTKNSCRGTMYLLTGTSDYGLIPDPHAKGKVVQDTSIPLPYTRRTFSDGVTLVTPRALWTAGCCVWKEAGRILGYWWPSSLAQSFAVMSNNQDDKNLLYQTEMSIARLEELLTAPKTPKVNLFPGYSACRSAANTISP